MKDWLGKDLAVGDKVIYAVGSGRSITMVIGEIVGFGERTETCYHGPDQQLTTIRVQPLRSSRWKQHRGTDYYVDARSGKRIDPWREAKDGTFPHIAVQGHYVDAAGVRHKQQRYSGSGHHEYTYVPTEFREYVEKRNDGPKPVTIHVTENVTKWDDDL